MQYRIVSRISGATIETFNNADELLKFINENEFNIHWEIEIFKIVKVSWVQKMCRKELTICTAEKH